MSDWKNKLKKASFRAVPFYVDVSEFEPGRKKVVHEIPYAESPYVEDMGRKTRSFTVDAHVIGDDYWSARDALQLACDTAGSGKLIHPYYGEKTVECLGIKIHEDTRAGRMAKFTLTFIEVGNVTDVIPQPDYSALIKNSSAVASTASVKSFSKKFSVLNTPARVVDNAISYMSAAVIAVQTVKNKLRTVSEAVTNVKLFTAKLENIIETPAELAESFAALIAYIPDDQSSDDAFSELKKLINYGDDIAIPVNTSTYGTVDSDNLQGVISLTQQIAIINAVSLVPDLTFDSSDSADAVKILVADKIDSMALTGIDDDLYASLMDMLSQAVKYIDNIAVSLPDIQSYTPSVMTNALALSHKLYGNLDYETDIITRNNISHPAFISGETILEVLTI
jgi:prophage DNA circulation protein